MAKRKEKDVSVETNNKREVIDLKEFMLLDAKMQDEKIKETLDIMYEGKYKIEKKHIEKVLNICFDTKDNEVYLPGSLNIAKNGSKLIFQFKKNGNLGLIILFALAFLFIGGFATYSGVQYLGRLQMNQDLDGDGIPDLNIDIDDDGICDINCDTDKDGKPDRNIDYHNNRKPIFNVVMEDESIFNPINQDINGDGICDINCDTNNDGWPDMNIDYDGDGEVDLDRDIDGDGIKDLDLDTNGDGVCDINCDDDKNNVCDKNCTNINIDDNGGGTSEEGNGGIDINAADLVVIYDNQDVINAENIYPDDQVGQGVNTSIPDLTFEVTNTTNNVLYYDLNWLVTQNTFESDNFWYRVTSDNNGFTQDWTTAPWNDEAFATRIAIEPHSTQNYTISFTLHGTGEEQNYDQGKIFNARVQVNLIEE